MTPSKAIFPTEAQRHGGNHFTLSFSVPPATIMIPSENHVTRTANRAFSFVFRALEAGKRRFFLFFNA